MGHPPVGRRSLVVGKNEAPSEERGFFVAELLRFRQQCDPTQSHRTRLNGAPTRRSSVVGRWQERKLRSEERGFFVAELLRFRQQRNPTQSHRTRLNGAPSATQPSVVGHWSFARTEAPLGGVGLFCLRSC